MIKLPIRKEFSVGEFLTFLSIVGSAISVMWSWSYDRNIRIRENADKIRVEAALVLGKVQRTQDIYLSFYEEVQGDLVEVSEVLVQTQSRTSARDLLWKRFQQRKTETQRRVLDEGLETAYTGLLAFDEGIDSLYITTMVRLKKANATTQGLLLQEAEAIVLDYDDKVNQTAILGNDLRKVFAEYKATHAEAQLKGALELETHVKALIRAPDKTLLERGDH